MSPYSRDCSVRNSVVLHCMGHCWTALLGFICIAWTFSFFIVYAHYRPEKLFLGEKKLTKNTSCVCGLNLGNWIHICGPSLEAFGAEA